MNAHKEEYAGIGGKGRLMRMIGGGTEKNLSDMRHAGLSGPLHDFRELFKQAFGIEMGVGVRSGKRQVQAFGQCAWGIFLFAHVE